MPYDLQIYKFINIKTAEIIEDDIQSSCSCKSSYSRNKDYKEINKLSVKELNYIINNSKVNIRINSVKIDKEIKELSVFNN